MSDVAYPQYYRFSLRALTLRQLYAWRSDPPGFLSALLFKLLGLGGSFPDPSLMRVLDGPPADSLARAPLGELVRDAEAEGLRPVLYETTPALPAIDNVTVALLSEDARVLLVVGASARAANGLVRSRARFQCTSRLADGRLLCTTGARPLLPLPPDLELFELLGASLCEVVRRHRERLVAEDVEPFDRTPAAITRHLQAQARRWADYLVERGFMRPMSAEEVAKARRP